MSKHQKAISSPKTYPIKRKERPWVIKPSPGPHSEENCVPVGIIIRDVLEYAENVSEVKDILKQGKCDIDAKNVRDHRFPVGIFDSLRLGEEYFRLVPSKKGFKLVNINKKEAGKKLCRIEDKNAVKGGKIQLVLNDGKSLIAEEGMEGVDTGTSMILSLPDKEKEDVIELEEDQEVMVIKGKNRGELASFKEKKVLKGSKENRIVVEKGDKKIDLPEGFAVPIDTDKIKIDSEEE